MGCNNVEEAEDGAVALHMLKTGRYDLSSATSHAQHERLRPAEGLKAEPA